MLNPDSYLARIGYSGRTEPTAENLRALHRAHMLAVPFENLDIHLGRPILCDEARFLHKIVDERRGGFCYELNGAFAALLRALGFPVALLSARVAGADGSPDSPEFDHLALLVNLDEPYLADVGFGDSFLEPLRLQTNLEQPQIGRVYRLIETRTETKTEKRTEADADWQMEVQAHRRWKRQFSFTLRPRQLSDFAARCHYHQTSPDSHFTRQRICSRATPMGRITLSDLKLIETRNEPGDGRRKERVLAGEQEWRAVLRETFEIDLPD